MATLTVGCREQVKDIQLSDIPLDDNPAYDSARGDSTQRRRRQSLAKLMLQQKVSIPRIADSLPDLVPTYTCFLFFQCCASSNAAFHADCSVGRKLLRYASSLVAGCL